MSYVDLMGQVRWSEQDHTNRSEALVRAQVSHEREHILMRRLFAFVFYVMVAMLPEGPVKAMLGAFAKPLPADALQELAAAAAIYSDAEAAATAGRADGALLAAAMDCEQAQAQLAALAVDDPARAGLQGALDATPAAVLALVAQRAAAHAPAGAGGQ